MRKVNTNGSTRSRGLRRRAASRAPVSRFPRPWDASRDSMISTSAIRLMSNCCAYLPEQRRIPITRIARSGSFITSFSGSGAVRHEEGTAPITSGDAFIFKPGEAHQISNDSGGDLLLYVVADNPIGEHHYYPDSKSGGRHTGPAIHPIGAARLFRRRRVSRLRRHGPASIWYPAKDKASLRARCPSRAYSSGGALTGSCSASTTNQPS
jgi:hypothetical protein